MQRRNRTIASGDVDATVGVYYMSNSGAPGAIARLILDSSGHASDRDPDTRGLRGGRDCGSAARVVGLFTAGRC